MFSEPFKYFNWQQPEIKLEQDGEILKISSSKPVKGVFIHGVELPDNMFDLMPDDVQTIAVSSLPESLKVQWLGGSGSLPVKRNELVIAD